MFLLKMFAAFCKKAAFICQLWVNQRKEWNAEQLSKWIFWVGSNVEAEVSGAQKVPLGNYSLHFSL